MFLAIVCVFTGAFLSQMEKAMAPHSSTLAWKILWMEEPGRLQSMESLSRTRLGEFTFTFSLSCIGEGNGNPLQCSCLENPRDGGAWRAAVYGVTQSRTRLKWLSSSSSSSASEEQDCLGWMVPPCGQHGKLSKGRLYRIPYKKWSSPS